MPLGLFGKKNTSGGVTLKPLTTYLGHLLKKDAGIADYSKIPYNGKEGTIENGRALLGRYEAVLTQATYMSRLIYDSNSVIGAAVQCIDYPPTAFNTALTLISNNGSKLNEKIYNQINTSIKDAFLINDPDHDTPCYMQVVDYKGQLEGGCPFPGKKVLYITFRGTNSIKTTITDTKAIAGNMNQLFEKCSMKGKKGTEVFANEISGGSINAHLGFIKNLENVMPQICSLLEERILTDSSIDEIVVTGHSLGGANASLCSLILAGFKRAGIILPSLHCITFGAPKLLEEYSRNVFNSFLVDGTMTFDRVANRVKNLLATAFGMAAVIDIIPTIRPTFVHPGFMILKHEIMTQSKTGRSKNISDIREMFGFGSSSKGFFKNLVNIGFNELPSYKEFLSCFTPIFGDPANENTIKKYESSLNNRFGTIYGPTIVMDKEIHSGTKEFKDEYKLIVEKCEKIIGQKLENITEKTEKETEAGVAEQVETAKQEAKNAGEAAAAEEESKNAPKNAPPPTGGAFAFTKAGQQYKDQTLEQGPNHIVYSCKQTISTVFCHAAYMGVGFNRVFRRIPKPDYAEIHVETMNGMPFLRYYDNNKTPVGIVETKINSTTNSQKNKKPNVLLPNIAPNSTQPNSVLKPNNTTNSSSSVVNSKNAINAPKINENNANAAYANRPIQGGARKHKTKKAGRKIRQKKTRSRKHKQRRH